MRRLFVLAALLFALPAQAVTIDWVTVGDPGNVADTTVMTCCHAATGTSGYGSVSDTYRISKYEVTNAQYAEFLNAVANTYPFADGFNGAACEVPAGTTSHSANCNWVVGDLTDVGAYTGSPSAYGTFDQGGNAWEWTEAISGTRRGFRGGALYHHFQYGLAASYRNDFSRPMGMATSAFASR